MDQNKSGESINIPIDFQDDDSEGDKTRGMSEPISPTESDEDIDLSEALVDVGPSDPPPPEDPVKLALEQSEAQVAQLRSEKQALYEQLLRRQAEFDNFRKRLERDKLESQDRAKADILKQLLPTLDNFERALKHATVRDDEGNDGGLRTGVELIYKQLIDLVQKQGLEPIKAVGQPFDPHLHEAVTTTPSDEVTENTVLEELQRGYLYNGKLVRPATVRVSVKK
jgi:molecular chaperone GrpE